LAGPYYVDWAVGDDSNAGTSEGAGNAWKTITKAMNTVAAGETVYVKATGPYLETATIVTAGTISGTITFEGYTSTPGDGGQATIDGESTRSYCVTYTVPITSTTKLFYEFKNFIFKRADFYNVNVSWDLVFRNCRFTNATQYGCDVRTGCLFENCLFDNNGAGGLNVGGQVTTVVGCRFENNTSDGAQITAESCFIDCVFVGNGFDAFEDFGVNGSYCVLVNCTIDGDGKTTNIGIDLGTSFWKRAAVVNCIIYDCDEGIDAINQGTRFISRNNLLNSNNTNYPGSRFQTFTGEVTSAPQFVDEAGGNYALAGASPARDAGYDGYLLNGSDQLRDIGAIESTSAAGAGGGASQVLKDGSQMV